VGARVRGSRPGGSRPSGKHFLRSSRFAAELVEQAAITQDDVVLEIGAGLGRITDALARRSSRVIAVELDPDLARGLRRRFSSFPKVEVVEGDILELPLPEVAFRAFGNVPFALTSAILRRLLDDPGSNLTRADVLVQYEVARKRAAVWPSTLASLSWLPWWEFSLVRHVSFLSFEPPPPVDAGMLSISRRVPPLLASELRPEFVRILRAGFRRAPQPLSRSLPHLVSERAWRTFARDRGIHPAASPADLDVFDWVELFKLGRKIPR
jgi:23S rRNA (adenine-N6)-dimethyltransferase